MNQSDTSDYTVDTFIYPDEDECSEENLDRFCPAPGSCTNSDGGFTCTCPEGYEEAAVGCQGKSYLTHYIKVVNCITQI